MVVSRSLKGDFVGVDSVSVGGVSLMHIRKFQPNDLEAVYDICVRTGAAGGDASALVEDPRLFGEIWAAPYVILEPNHAHVLDDGFGRVVGYVVGTLDAVAFEQRCEIDWWPALRDRYPMNDSGDRLDDLLIALIHSRPAPREDLHVRYPSELHIDLLAQAQGRGWGRRLLSALFDGLRDAGSPGVHLGVSVENSNAVAFYRHIGFDELDSDGVTRHFGYEL